jgi:hypothetical protein
MAKNDVSMMFNLYNLSPDEQRDRVDGLLKSFGYLHLTYDVSDPTPEPSLH